MGLFSFIREAGEKLFNRGEATAQAATATPTPADDEAANRQAAEAIEKYIKDMALDVTGLTATFDHGVVRVFGIAADQATREKVILCCGNVAGVESVEDSLSVRVESNESAWHTVEKGDTLWKISEKAYGNGSKYMAIYEANRPMLSHPDKIYPGQKLRVPATA